MKAHNSNSSSYHPHVGFRQGLLGLFAGCAIVLLLVPSYGQLNSVLNKLSSVNKPGLDEGKIASGLKEALQVGTANAVQSTGRPNGYFGNPAIKILLPQKLQLVEKGLRVAGKGPQVDDFVLSMNRAAEQAAPLAKPIFLDALKQMTFQDARKILSGSDTAATDYFKQKTSTQLAVAFKPPVDKAMANTGVERKYNSLLGAVPALPFGKTESLDINHYVISKSLDGLFYVLGQEEKKIRKDPAAQVTPLLKQVFGR